MEITQVNTTDKIGGAGIVGYRLHREYRNKGLNSNLFVGLKTSNDNDICAINPLYNFSMHIPYVRTKVRKMQFLEGFSRNRFKKIVKDSDVVHLHNIHGGYFRLENLQELSYAKKIVWTLHDMWLFTANEPHTNENYWMNENLKNLESKLKEIIEGRIKLLKNLDITYVLPSKWLNDKFEMSFLKDKKHVIVNNGVDLKEFYDDDKIEARKRLNLPLDKKILLFQAQGGRNNKWKGGDVWMNLVKEFADNPNILFVEIGRNKKTEWEGENYLSVEYISDMNLMRDYFNSADILCFPSSFENFSLVLMEAIATGLPVVGFDVGGNSELIENGKNGFLVKKDDLKSYSNSVNKLLSDTQLLETFVKENLEKSKSKLSLDIMVNNYLEIYKTI